MILWIAGGRKARQGKRRYGAAGRVAVRYGLFLCSPKVTVVGVHGKSPESLMLYGEESVFYSFEWKCQLIRIVQTKSKERTL